MNTTNNMCVTTGLVAVFFLAGCGSTGTTESPLKGFSNSAGRPTEIERNKAAAGDSVAQFNLALKYDMAGRKTVAAKWYRKAADSGLKLKQAQFNYALMLEKGAGVQQNIPLAADYYERAAKQGLAKACYNLALMLAEGRPGVSEDDKNAVEWMKRAADQGYPDAQFQMGYLHRVGEGVPKDDAEAAKWFLQAAENLNKDAQYYVGLCFAHGIGVEQDLVEAYKWLHLAAEPADNKSEGHAGALRDKEMLTDQMAPEAEAEGLRLSREFQAAQ